LIETINEKDDLLECHEDLLVKENKKFVKLKNAYALEVEKCENLSKELSMCHDSITSLRTKNYNLASKIEKLNVCNDSNSCLRDENTRLNAKIEELNACKPSTSTIDHVTICTRCRDVNIEAMDDHLAMIKQQNDHIAKLTAKITEHELENKKFKFARSMLYNRRRPGIKDGIGFQQGSQSNVKLNAPKRLSNFVKGKAPMAQDSEGYILYPANYPEHKIKKLYARKPHTIFHHAFMYKNEASSSRHSLMLKCLKRKFLMHQMSIMFHLRLLMLLLTNKSGKVVAKYVGGKHKSPKTCVWVPKVLVSNVKGPNTIWVPKNKA
jgi:hypothetical protein